MPEGKIVIHELAELRNRTAVFRDRVHAGEILAGMLTDLRDADEAVMLAIPAGGVPVAAALCERLGLGALDVAVASKITLPWNPETGYGAVAFDGTVRLNNELIAALALGERVVQDGVAQTREKVQQRVRRLRGDEPFPALARRTAVVVDDGVASGFTLLAAAEALRRHGPQRLIVAVPTGHAEAVRKLADLADAIYCANMREGTRFAVADAYTDWHDVDEETAIQILHRFRHGGGDGRQHPRH